MIPLMKNTFLKEYETKAALGDFIAKANKLSMDINCLEFEREFAKFQHRKHSILCNSGASANLIIFQALLNLGRLKPGDKIGFSAVTWSTNVMPIIQLGLVPIPIDCDPSTLNSMSYNLEAAIKKDKLKAFFATNVLGITGDLDVIAETCKKNDIVFIEDNCESLGSEMAGKMAGNFGVCSSFSFFVAHHMSTIEGGMVCTDDDELAEMLVIVRANGWDRNLNSNQQKKWRTKFDIKSEFDAKYTFYDLAYNVRPTEITGFLGLYQLKYLPESLQARQKHFLQVRDIVNGNPNFLPINVGHMSFVSSFAMTFVCKTPELRDHYIKEFAGAGIEIRPMIAGNMQRQPFFKKYNANDYSLEGADLLHNCAFYCGNYPELTEMDVQIITSCIR